MLDTLNTELKIYFKNWQTAASNAALTEMATNAVGWKVADEPEYQKIYAELKPSCDRIIETWMNGRWIAKLHLKDTALTGNIKIIKLMQRRPGSEDALGLDHVDFICKDITVVETKLKSAGIKWSWETNDIIDDYNWISVWFNGTEAKIKEYSVIDIVIKEIQELDY